MDNIQKRDLFMDNLKGFLIFCVVLGHFLEKYQITHPNLKYLIFFIYLFHMPCFIYISGYFSKKYDFQKNCSLIYSFIIFGILYISIVNCFPGYALEFQFAHAPWALWYLIALFLWRTFMLFFKKIYPIVIILIAFVCAILVGCLKDIGTYFNLARLIGFFPFFLLGYYSNEQIIAKIRSINKGFIFVLAILMVLFTYIIVTSNLFPLEFQWSSKSFADLHIDNTNGIIYKILLLVLEILSSIAIFNIIPNVKKENLLSKIGKNSITVYGFHTIFVFTITYFIKDVYPYKGLIYIMIFLPSFLLSLLLSSKPVRKFYDILMLPYKKISGNGDE